MKISLRIKEIILAVVGVIVLTVSSAYAAQVYKVDLASSAVGFTVTRYGVTFVRGQFEKFSGTMTVQGEQLLRFTGSVDMTSLKTGNTQRDNDLKADHFFAAAKYPAMTIKSRQITQSGEQVEIESDLTVRDITKPVTFTGTLRRNDQSQKTTELLLKGTINRKEFGLRLSNFFEFFVNDNVYVSLKLNAV